MVAVFVSLLSVTWRDFRLVYDPLFIGSSAVQLPADSVWEPPVELYNCLGNKEQHEQRQQTPVEVRYDGHVSLLWYSKIDTICVVDVEAFPFDEQWCNFGFAPGLASIDQLEIVSLNHTENLQGIPEWEIFKVLSFQSSFDQYGRTYSISEITFHLKRNSQFYIFFVILPTYLVTAICISAMLLPLEMEIGDRINLGIAGLISLTFMLSVIVGELPRTPTLPLMGKWVIIEMFFCSSGMCIPMISAVFESKVFRNKFRKIASVVTFTVFTLANLFTTIFLFAFPPVRKAPTQFYS